MMAGILNNILSVAIALISFGGIFGIVFFLFKKSEGRVTGDDGLTSSLNEFTTIACFESNTEGMKEYLRVIRDYANYYPNPFIVKVVKPFFGKNTYIDCYYGDMANKTKINRAKVTKAMNKRDLQEFLLNSLKKITPAMVSQYMLNNNDKVNRFDPDDITNFSDAADELLKLLRGKSNDKDLRKILISLKQGALEIWSSDYKKLIEAIEAIVDKSSYKSQERFNELWAKEHKCPNCGAAIPFGSDYCSYCGTVNGY